MRKLHPYTLHHDTETNCFFPFPSVWALISRHESFSQLNLNDFKSLAEELVVKVKCHGFGAVIEEFEVQDSLASLFSKKQGFAQF